MPWVEWRPVQRDFCDRVHEQVVLEAQVVFPPDMLPDQPPRVLGHRCSLGLQCNAMDRPTCCWAGTLPGFDPFA
jgi:hypothetical protein